MEVRMNPYGYNVPNMYGNNTFTPQMPYSPPVTQPQLPFGQQSNLIWVHGIQGGNAYKMGANQSVILLDETAPLAFFKRTDSAGYATMDIFDLTPHKESETDLQSIEQRLAKLEARLNESDTASSKPKQPANGKNARNDGHDATV